MKKDEYLKLREPLDEATARVEGLKARIIELNGILKDDPNVAAMVEKDEKKKEIIAAETERRKLAERAETARVEIRAGILAEARAKYDPALREFHKRLQAAAAAEQALLDIERDFDGEMSRYLPGEAHPYLMPAGAPNLTLIQRNGPSLMNELKSRAEMSGYKLD